MNRFIQTPGVNFNLLARLSTLEEENRLANEQHKQRILQDIVGTVAKTGATIYGQAQESKMAQRKYNQDLYEKVVTGTTHRIKEGAPSPSEMIKNGTVADYIEELPDVGKTLKQWAQPDPGSDPNNPTYSYHELRQTKQGDIVPYSHPIDKAAALQIMKTEHEKQPIMTMGKNYMREWVTPGKVGQPVIGSDGYPLFAPPPATGVAAFDNMEAKKAAHTEAVYKSVVDKVPIKDPDTGQQKIDDVTGEPVNEFKFNEAKYKAALKAKILTPEDIIYLQSIKADLGGNDSDPLGVRHK